MLKNGISHNVQVKSLGYVHLLGFAPKVNGVYSKPLLHPTSLKSMKYSFRVNLLDKPTNKQTDRGVRT